LKRTENLHRALSWDNWLGDGWTLILHQKLLQCEGSVTVYIFMVQDWIISPVFCQMSSFKFSELWYKKWNPLFVLQGQTYLHHSQVVKNTISMTCWDIVIHGLYFQGNALVCHSEEWHFISGS
jgi:hypothetical protein